MQKNTKKVYPPPKIFTTPIYPPSKNLAKTSWTLPQDFQTVFIYGPYLIKQSNFTLRHLNEKKILKAVKTVSDNVETAHLFV